MYAIVKTGGKQYRVAPNDILRVEKLPGAPGDLVVLDQVLMVATDKGLEVGAPLVKGASVACELVDQIRGRKIIIFKKKRRKHYRRKRGHRQHYTVLKVLEILTDGAKPSVKPGAGKAAAAAAGAGAAAALAASTGAEKADDAAKAAKKKSEKKAAASADEAKKTSKKAGAGGKGKAAGESDDISLISGIGPVLEKRLREAGITTFRQIAELTPEQAKELDERLNLHGRIEREEWIEQAKELMAGKAPRAKIDQKKQAQNEKKAQDKKKKK